MDKFDIVKREFVDLPYMKHEQAIVLRDLILEEDAKDILEIGFSQGKSSAYIAAILEDRGEGNLTTLDRRFARKKDPNIETVLDRTGLAHRVTPIYCFRSYTWGLQKLVNTQNRPQFDFCYFDGGHTWDDTGFGVFLVDILLRPGGLLILNELDWSIAKSPYYKRNPDIKASFSKDEQTALPVRLVWDTILPHLGYDKIREYKGLRWGAVRKPMGGAGPTNAQSQALESNFSLFEPGVRRKFSDGD